MLIQKQKNLYHQVLKEETKRKNYPQYKVLAEFPLKKGIFDAPHIYICFSKNSQPFVVKGNHIECKRFLTHYKERLLVHEIHTMSNNLITISLMGQGRSFNLNRSASCAFLDDRDSYLKCMLKRNPLIVSNIDTATKFKMNSKGSFSRPYLKGHRCYHTVSKDIVIHLHCRTTPRGWRPEFDQLWDHPLK